MLTGVGVDGNDWHLLHQHRFCLVKQAISLVTRLCLGRSVENNVVVDVVGVASVVVSALGNEEVEEIVRVNVITNPAAARNLEVTLRNGV